jgi:hypothetical protein
MEFITEHKDSNGQVVILGDILSSPSTHDVIVMFDLNHNKFVVKILDDDIVFDLDEFMLWEGLSIKNNINFYNVV